LQAVSTLGSASPIFWLAAVAVLALNVLPFVLGGLAFRKHQQWSLLAVPVGLSVLSAVMIIFDVGFESGPVASELWLLADAVFCTHAWKVLKSPES